MYFDTRSTHEKTCTSVVLWMLPAGHLGHRNNGGFNPPEEYWSLGIIILNRMKHSTCSRPQTSLGITHYWNSMGLIELIPHDSLVNHHHQNMIRSRHPPFSGSPKKNISVWCREISPWISQCWFNQPFSGPGGYQVGFIDPMTNISKQCNMSVGKSRKRKQQHTYMCCFTWL